MKTVMSRIKSALSNLWHVILISHEISDESFCQLLVIRLANNIDGQIECVRILTI